MATATAIAAAKSEAVSPSQRGRDAAKLVADNPAITGKELGALLGLSERSGRRILSGLEVEI